MSGSLLFGVLPFEFEFLELPDRMSNRARDLEGRRCEVGDKAQPAVYGVALAEPGRPHRLKEDFTPWIAHDGMA